MRRRTVGVPALRISQILEWADDDHRRTGRWPTAKSGTVQAATWEKWANVEAALRGGFRGLPGGSSLADLLWRRRGYRHQGVRPGFTEKLVLRWADEYHRRTGRWPNGQSGPIHGAPGERWSTVSHALRQGQRGLPGGDSLGGLLSRRRGVRNPRGLPPLTIKTILRWADRHFRRFKRWPTQKSGEVCGEPGESWGTIQTQLNSGGRGLPGGESLGHLLAVRRGARNNMNTPRLTIAKILKWADEHRARTGQWPSESSGPIHGQPGETWRAIVLALYNGGRGLPRGGDTLARLLARRRGHRNISGLPKLTFERILAWADAHHRRHGVWPTPRDGAVEGAPGETWRNVAAAMDRGGRGLDYPLSLPKLLAQRRGRWHLFAPPPLTLAQIIEWAKAHRARTGRWPHDHSGRIPEAPDESWAGVDNALRDGRRGLPAGWSLPMLLKERAKRRAAVTKRTSRRYDGGGEE